jgi:ribosome maturation factor RimP
MDRQTLEYLKGVIGLFIKEKGYELVDLYYKYESGRTVLAILADRPDGGITIDECGILNREIGSMFDEKGIIQDRYVLEVSSPGIDRPLRTGNDFRRCAGKEVIAYLRQPINGKTQLRGIIKEAADVYILFDEQGQAVEIPLENITKAKQVI